MTQGGRRNTAGVITRTVEGHVTADHGAVCWVWITSGLLCTLDIRILSAALHTIRLAPDFPDVTTA